MCERQGDRARASEGERTLVCAREAASECARVVRERARARSQRALKRSARVSRMRMPVCLARAVCELRCAQLVQNHNHADGIALGLLTARRCRHLQHQQGQQPAAGRLRRHGRRDVDVISMLSHGPLAAVAQAQRAKGARAKMNTYNRAQGMDNRLNMLFNQELDNEAQYIKSHPFSSINMSLGGEVRYIAPIWPWNAPRFKVLLPPDQCAAPAPGGRHARAGARTRPPPACAHALSACRSPLVRACAVRGGSKRRRAADGLQFPRVCARADLPAARPVHRLAHAAAPAPHPGQHKARPGQAC